MNELNIGESIKENYLLWRYMTLDKLINILVSKTLFFTPLKSYQETDPFEGYMPLNGLKKIAEVSEKRTSKQIECIKKLRANYEQAKVKHGPDPKMEQQLQEIDVAASQSLEANMDSFDKIAKAVMVNCWHANDYESEAMWKLYSDDGKGIAITTNIELLKKSINPIHDDVRISIGKVKYIDFFDLTLNAEDYIVDGNILPLTKRLSYKHENEIRMYTTPKFEAGAAKIEAKPYFLQIDPLVLIDKVYISPYAKEPYISSTIEVCKMLGLNENKIKHSDLLNSTNYLRNSFGL